MAHQKIAGKNPVNKSETTNKQEVTETLQEANEDSAAKDAQKKEKQPRVPDDLSPLLNTKEVGTSGGDQRASETESKNEST